MNAVLLTWVQHSFRLIHPPKNNFQQNSTKNYCPHPPYVIILISLSRKPSRNFRVDIYCEPLAQLVEHLTFNQRVEGSSPSWLTKDFCGSKISIIMHGPLVKRLRHRPFTAVTRVRIPYGSYLYFLLDSLFGNLIGCLIIDY
jgi:hypothetical protein